MVSEETETSKNYVMIEVPSMGEVTLIKTTKLIVRGYNGDVLVEGWAILERDEAGFTPTVIISEDMAGVIAIRMEDKRKSCDVEPEINENDPGSVMDEIRETAIQLANDLFRDQNYATHSLRLNECMDSLSDSAREIAFEAYNKRLAELVNESDELEELRNQLRSDGNYADLDKQTAKAYENSTTASPIRHQIRAVARQIAFDFFTAEPISKGKHVDRWNEYYNSLEGDENRKFAAEAYDERISEMGETELIKNERRNDGKNEIESTAKQFAEDVYYSASKNSTDNCLQRWNLYLRNLTPSQRDVARKVYHKHWEGLVNNG